MKKVHIYAYNQMNLGDDLFIKILCNRYSNVKFQIVATPTSAKAFKDIKNLDIVHTVPYVDAIFRKLKVNISISEWINRRVSKNCDVIVNIGGSLFIQGERWRYDAKNYKKRILDSKPYILLGSNFGPYDSIEFYNCYKDIFQSINDICFRESYSYNMFKELGNVRYSQDVVFTMDNVNEENKVDNSVLISVMDFSNRDELKMYYRSYIEKLNEIINYCILQGHNIVLMGFCPKEGDDKVIKELLEINNFRDEIDQYNYYGNIDEALNKIKISKYIIATRFHSIILGFLYSKPVYPIIYSKKSINVLNDIKFDGTYSEVSEIGNVCVETIYKQLKSFNYPDIKVLRDSANNQFLFLDELLKE